jgi:hypothetical protein
MRKMAFGVLLAGFGGLLVMSAYPRDGFNPQSVFFTRQVGGVLLGSSLMVVGLLFMIQGYQKTNRAREKMLKEFNDRPFPASPPVREQPTSRRWRNRRDGAENLEDPQRCDGCGCLAEQGEAFRAGWIEGSTTTEGPSKIRDLILCPRCEAKQDRLGKPLLEYKFCDQCNGPIEHGRGRTILRTESQQTGAVTASRIVELLLCPTCASQHDRTSKSLTSSLLLLVGVVVLAALVSLLFR